MDKDNGFSKEKIEKTMVQNAIDAMENSYSVYSGFRVGAAVLGDNGKIYKGTNIENISYGLTMCAERVAIFSAISDGVKVIKILSIAADTDDPISPCGACRQVMAEFSDKDTKIIMSDKNGKYVITDINGLLPYAFKKL